MVSTTDHSCFNALGPLIMHLEGHALQKLELNTFASMHELGQNRARVVFNQDRREALAVACCANEQGDLGSIPASSKCFFFSREVGWNQT